MDKKQNLEMGRTKQSTTNIIISQVHSKYSKFVNLKILNFIKMFASVLSFNFVHCAWGLPYFDIILGLLFVVFHIEFYNLL